MTDEQRSFYLLLCMTGRTQEATEYREKIEKQEDNTCLLYTSPSPRD